MALGRRQVELSFDWIEQNLRIKAFYGATENAAKARIGVAISVRVSAATQGHFTL